MKNNILEFENEIKLVKIKSEKGLNFMKGNLSLKSSEFIDPIEMHEFIQLLRMDIKG